MPAARTAVAITQEQQPSGGGLRLCQNGKGAKIYFAGRVRIADGWQLARLDSQR